MWKKRANINSLQNYFKIFNLINVWNSDVIVQSHAIFNWNMISSSHDVIGFTRQQMGWECSLEPHLLSNLVLPLMEDWPWTMNLAGDAK